MKRLSVVLVGALAAAAQAGPRFEPKREPPLPPKVQEIAHGLFDEALAATSEGKLDEAVQKYLELERLSPHPNISFNLALIYEAKGDVVKALAQYDDYLKDAAPAEAAKVKPHVEELRSAPGHVDAEVRTKYGTKALWFVDGVLTARGSASFDVPNGKRRFDLVTEIGYAHDRVVVEPGQGKGRGNRLSFSADERKDGNLVVSSSPNNTWSWFYAIDGSDRNDALGKDTHRDGRYTIEPGKHTVMVKDEVCDYDATIDVRAGELTYVYFDRTGYDAKALLHDRTEPRRRSPFCGQILVKRTIVNFDAKLPAHPFTGKPSD